MSRYENCNYVCGAYGHTFVIDKNGRVIGAWTPNGQNYKRPYKTMRYVDGLVDCAGEYTPEQVREKMYRKTLSFL